jgi:hypothetical protein
MLPFWFQKLILGLCGLDRSKTGEADGVKGTILVWSVRIIEDQLIGHTSASSLGRAPLYSNLAQKAGQFSSIYNQT